MPHTALDVLRTWDGPTSKYISKYYLCQSVWIMELFSADLITFINKAINDGDINHIKYGEFTNIEKIGEGGFNTVYKAEWKKGGLTVALKNLKDISLEGMTVKKSDREV
ncbi:4121_t:CDS:2 [Racocetra fulgida]|uniref:4121_t:CDS:1 n=1 Tax=Racocetra fulgida TaxID=60492 RepID=A0A9N8W166_9GLOM|nr:4121_t:CDS:2 [Racocetra fulgida]